MSEKAEPGFDAQQRMLGVGVRIQRNTRVHLRHLPRLQAHAAALQVGLRDPEHLVAERLERLRARLWRSPLWSRWLLERGHSPNELTSLQGIARLPCMDRETLGRGWREAFALGLEPDSESELSIAISSGSSGRAIPVTRDGYDNLHMWAALEHWVAVAGAALPPKPRVSLLCTLPGGLQYSARLPHFHGGALHRISTVLPRPRERLEKASPAVLFSDPAGFHWIAAHAPRIRPALLLSSAQHLPAARRREVEAQLGAPLLNYYATTEAGPIAWECRGEEGVFHALQPDVFVESVQGEVVVTRLRDSVLPLVRYRTGDFAEVREHGCGCGFRGRSLFGFTGRRACAFVRADGERVDAWNLIWLFKDLPLVGFRMTQLTHERFELLVDAPLPMAVELLKERLELALVRLGWRRPTVEIRRVGSLQQPLKPETFVTRVA